MDVVSDLLDAPVLDHQGREMGRVDGIEIDARAGRPPRLTTVLIGPSVLGSRLHPAVGRWVGAIGVALGLDEGRPIRIDAGSLDPEGDMKTSLSLATSAAGAVEQRARGWLRFLPGGR
jgi:sporulation protein YlmC with PRC-barrel domain